jgi:hypothetical protein
VGVANAGPLSRLFSDKFIQDKRQNLKSCLSIGLLLLSSDFHIIGMNDCITKKRVALGLTP